MKNQSSQSTPFVTIVVPLYVICDRFFRDLHKFDSMQYQNYEILIICDKKVRLPRIRNIRLIVTGRSQTGPAEKRDIALLQAKGSICAFIDDDAYPDPAWITTAVRHFVRNKDIIAVGGPGITPPDDGRMAQLGGLVYESDYTSGGLKMRFLAVETRSKEVSDWPAYNLFIRTGIMKKVGGWGSKFYGGEDTYICLKMLSYGRIIYEPGAIVYHHRRPLFWPHMKQIFNVGVHRGFFFKKYPETSRQFIYFLPAILTFGFWIMLAASFFSPIALGIFLLIFGIFFGMGLSTVLYKTDIPGAVLASLGILFTHMAYGIGFIKGLLTGDLQR